MRLHCFRFRYASLVATIGANGASSVATIDRSPTNEAVGLAVPCQWQNYTAQAEVYRRFQPSLVCRSDWRRRQPVGEAAALPWLSQAQSERQPRQARRIHNNGGRAESHCGSGKSGSAAAGKIVEVGLSNRVVLA
jgi:hypothetical protein